MKRVKLFFSLLFLVLLRFATINAEVSESQFRTFVGITNADRVNVRAGSNLNFEILTQLSKGDKIIVLGEDNGWYRIKMPESAAVYINVEYLREKEGGIPGAYEVTGKRVNVRAGPGINYNVLGQVNSGDVVSVVGIENNKWCKISPPDGCFSWIFADFVEFYSSVEEYRRQEKKAEAIRQKYGDLLKRADGMISGAPDMVEISNLLKNCREFIANYSGYPEADLLAGKIKKLELKKAETKYLDEARKLTRARSKLEKKIIELERGGTEPDKPPTAVGKLEDLGKIINRPGTHKLMSEGRTTYYLKSSKCNLNRYIYYPVAVWGEIIHQPEWKYPLIIAEEIRVLMR